MATDTVDLTAEKESSSVVLDTRRTRPRFFDGKFLTAADLVQEQSYLLRRQADMARTLGFGVVAGLGVTRAARSASDLPNPAASVDIAPGHGLTPAGELVYLPRKLTIDLDKVATMLRLNAAFGLSEAKQQPFASLGGLFVLGLRAVEFTANPAPAYPAGADSSGSLRDGEIIEATAVTLVPYGSAASLQTPALARIRAAREVFLEQKPPQLPAGVLPLAMVFLRNGSLEWVDEWLVRREAGDDDRYGFGFAPRALAEAHFNHYRIIYKLAPAAGAGQLAAKSFLEILPPGGPLPDGVINSADFTQAYFPPEARVELALVPEDELPALMEDTIDLPPIDLALKPEDQDALSILILAPIPRADYGNTLQTLARTPQPVLRSASPLLLNQQKPIQALLKLNATFELRQRQREAAAAPAAANVTPDDDAAPDFVDPAWREALKKAKHLWYLRRRNLPEGQGLASTPLPATTEIAATTPATTPGEVPAPAAMVNAAASEAEARLIRALAGEDLWGRHAFLRAIADTPAHSALVRLLGSQTVLGSPLLQQAIVTALEKALAGLSTNPLENFGLIQKEPGVKALTVEIVATVGKQFARASILRDLAAAFADHPRILAEKPLRAVLGLSDRVGLLTELGVKFAARPEFKSLMDSVEKSAVAGRPQDIADAVDLFVKKVR